jgi:hypothetical protein
MTDDKPFEDIEFQGEAFSIPDLKWRELVFVGAVRLLGDVWVRDLSRPIPPFRARDLFPEGGRFKIRREKGRVVVVAEPTTRPPSRGSR